MSQNTESRERSRGGTDPLPGDSAFSDGRFPDTRWSVVTALHHDDEGAAADALARLCRMYWFPLYAYVRRRGYARHEAQDLTQEFFRRLLELDSLADARRAKGRMRSFLLTLMKRFLANEWKRSHAQKRGGGRDPISIDQEWAEDRYRYEPADNVTPEDLYARHWALTLLDEVLDALRDEYVKRDKKKLYDTLVDSLAWNSGEVPHGELAERLGMTKGAVSVAVHRMRARYRELLLREIERTVESPEEVADEIQFLFSTFAR